MASALLLALVLLSASAPAWAGQGDDLFVKGKALLETGHLTEACDTLAEADHLLAGVQSGGLLAACHEKQGRLATAFREYQETARRAVRAHDPRERFALDRASMLEPKVPRLSLRIQAGEKVRVMVAGREIDPSTLATSTLVDPGPTTVVVTGESSKSWSTTVTLEVGEARTVEVPSMAAPQPEPKQKVSRGAPGWPVHLAGGVGVAGLGVMTGFGAAALVTNRDSVDLEARCKAKMATDRECSDGRAERGRAKDFGNVATVGFAVGLAGLATAGILWALDVRGAATSSDGGKTTVSLGPGPGFGAGLDGRF